MPEDIEKVIYKLELDPSSYIAGVESLSNSTKKLTTEQERANKALEESQNALKANTDFLAKTKKSLEDYTGTNEKYRQQLNKTFQSAQDSNEKLTAVVQANRKEYDLATKAAQNFADVAARAANLQGSTTGGKIPTSAPAGVPQGITNQIAGVLNVADFTKQAQVLEQTKAEFDDLRVSITLAEARMKQLNSTDEEFKALAPIVAAGKDALEQYDNSVKIAGNSTERFRTQILQGRDALAGLEQAGKQNTQEFIDLQNHVAKLTQEYHIAEEEIRVLSSQTRAFDFGKAAVGAAINTFQVYSAVSILAGGASEELQKKTMQLFAAMQLLTALEQLATSVKKGSILYTNLSAVAQATYTFVVAASTSALGAFKLALAATGIGAAIVAVGFLVTKYLEYKDAVKQAGAAQKLLSEVTEAAIKNFTAETVHLDLIKDKLDDLNIPQSKRIELAKEYNKTAEEGNKLDLDQIDNINLINEAIDRQIQKIKQRAFAKAAENIITERSQVLFLAEEKARASAEKTREAAEKFLADHPVVLRTDKKLRGVVQQEIIDAINATTAAGIANDPGVKEAQKNLDTALKALGPLIDIDGLFKHTHDPKETIKKEIQDDFEQRKAEYMAQLSTLAETEFESELTIRKKYKDKLDKELLKISKDETITSAEDAKLRALAGQVNDAELTKALKDYAKKVKDARQKLNDELQALEDKNATDQLNLIQNEFERRAKLIDFNEQKELALSKENTQKRLDAIDLQRLLIGEEAYQNAKGIIISTGEQNTLNIVQKFTNERQILAQNSFKDLLTYFEASILSADVVYERDAANALIALRKKYDAGKISYEDFQKGIVKIEDAYNKSKAAKQIDSDTLELASLNARIAAEKDTTSAYYKWLIQQRDQYEIKVSKGQADAAKKTKSPGTEDPLGGFMTEEASKQLSRIDFIQEKIQSVTESVISFWQKSNEAEEAALDRSIALQEKRVDAAQKIADRGNAQYLKQEQDRLTQLNVQRENAARKQLGIDAALQASQILVGITGAISKIATPGIGPAEVIAEIAVIIGALATGYGIVKSLQGNQPKLAKGSKYVKRDGHPQGTDTIPAMINEGEAVIPTNRNKAYHPTVSAIYDGTVPAEHLNAFVKNYHRIKSVPMPDYSRIRDAAELSIGHDGKMHVALTEQNRLIQENNDLQRTTIRVIKSIQNNVTLDKNGFAYSFMEVVEQMKLNKNR